MTASYLRALARSPRVRSTSAVAPVPNTPALSAERIAQLVRVLAATASGDNSEDVQDTLNAMCTESHFRKPPEDLPAVGNVLEATRRSRICA